MCHTGPARYPVAMLRIDYANCLSERVGLHGLDPARLDPAGEAQKAVEHLTARLEETRGTGWERWRLLPHALREEHISACRAVADERQGQYDNLLVLGIGGSALGNIALHSALNPPTWNLHDRVREGRPRLFVVDNVDPANFGAVLDACRALGGLERTLVNVISKSGETAETAAQFMIVRDMLKRELGDRHREQIVAITDPAKGTMRSICDREGYATLPVPEGVGGRFSVLSPVGLFSSMMVGIDVEGLLDGAATMDERCRVPSLRENPAALLATLLVELAARKGKTNHVMMPYSNALYMLADWFRQLWAESLGKRVDTRGEEVFAGFTPIKALGTTDQHSQVQLYREGPNDKVIAFVEVEDFGEHDIAIPEGLGVEALAYLEGKTLAQLLNAEKRATEYALVESRRPNLTIRFPTIDAQHVGEFIWLWQMTTAYAGLMLGVNAYDQPAVELGKQATFGLMGRRGYEEHLQKVRQTLVETEWVV